VSENWKLQQNVKVGQDLINLRGDNPDEFKAVLEWAVENAALFVNVQAALNAVEKVPALAGNVTSTQVQQDGPPAQQNSGWGAPQGQQPPSFANPAQAGPACQHGPMVQRSGEKNGRSWSGWFCPTPKGTPGQCQPQFGKG
jgi:hypothetical protein